MVLEGLTSARISLSLSNPTIIFCNGNIGIGTVTSPPHPRPPHNSLPMFIDLLFLVHLTSVNPFLLPSNWRGCQQLWKLWPHLVTFVLIFRQCFPDLTALLNQQQYFAVILPPFSFSCSFSYKNFFFDPNPLYLVSISIYRDKECCDLSPFFGTKTTSSAAALICISIFDPVTFLHHVHHEYMLHLTCTAKPKDALNKKQLSFCGKLLLTHTNNEYLGG